jgi:hypothetical protein
MSSSHFWRLDTAHTVVQKISQHARFDGEVDVLGYVARPPLLPGCTGGADLQLRLSLISPLVTTLNAARQPG